MLPDLSRGQCNFIVNLSPTRDLRHEIAETSLGKLPAQLLGL
jgi:hypothetical protein